MAYPELVSGGFPSHTFKWLVKVSASKCVIRVDLKKSWPGGFRTTRKPSSQKLQDDIDKLVKWSEKWQMLFNFGKCKCLHTGSGNTGENYEMGGTILSKTVKEKDLGVTMNANMKVCSV